MDKWFSKNYKNLKDICKKVSKESEVDELLHFCIDQVITNPKFIEITEDSGKLYYFTRVVINNWKSTSSRYYIIYRKDKPKIIYDGSIKYEPEPKLETELEIDMGWVETQLKTIKEKEWYYGRIFELYIEEGCSLTKLSKRTTIPVNSLSRDIKKVRLELLKKRKQDLYGL